MYSRHSSTCAGVAIGSPEAENAVIGQRSVARRPPVPLARGEVGAQHRHPAREPRPARVRVDAGAGEAAEVADHAQQRVVGELGADPVAVEVRARLPDTNRWTGSPAPRSRSSQATS